MQKVTIQFNEEDPIEIGKTNDGISYTLDEPGTFIKFENKDTGETFTIRLEEDDNTN